MSLVDRDEEELAATTVLAPVLALPVALDVVDELFVRDALK